MVPSGATTRPMMPVSSSTSRTAACSAVSPASMWPLGSDHSRRPRRSSRPISAAVPDAGGPPRGRPPRSRRPCAAGADARRDGPRGARRSDRGRWTCGDGNDAATPWPAARHRDATGLRSRLCSGAYTGPPCARAPSSPPSSYVRRRMRRWTSCRSTRSPTSSRPGSPRPATGSTSSAAACATPCSAGEQTDLDFTTDARPDRGARRCSTGWAEAVWDTGIAFGTVGARRHGTTVEITTFRADAYDRVSRNPVVAFGDDDRGRPGPPRLHRQRDGRRADRWPVERTRSSTRTAASPRWPPACSTPRPRPRSRSPTTRCGCCGRRGSSPSSASRRHRGSSRR